MKIRKTILGVLYLLATIQLCAQWEPQGDKIKTKWAEQIDVQNILPEYPRPLMERKEWKNLNGLWNYAIQPLGHEEPVNYQGKILVPFAVESSLSGVMKSLGEENVLWYSLDFSIPKKWNNKQILLHFGAVDWKCEVYINDNLVGKHTGAYTPFFFNITPFIHDGEQKLEVKVWDGTDKDYQPRGKQVSTPEGIWYTPVSGIWQTVWLEPVNEKHLLQVKTIPDIDAGKLNVYVLSKGASPSDTVIIELSEGSKLVTSVKTAIDQVIELKIPNARLWSPDNPFLYDLEVQLYENGKKVDQVKSYAAMRKISTHRDEKGIVRLQLNNKNCFHFGPLDQGWWPDGLYTAPSDEALKYDIRKTKDLAYNTIRKHVKVEPARWYTHCDRMGILVWQDMPNGDLSPQWQNRDYFSGEELIRSPESEANYRKEWKEIIDFLSPHPSVVVWVPFNEAWGQFKTKQIVELTKAYDPSRLVNPASGGNHYPVGDMLDLHNYPQPELYLDDPERALVLGEYGGIGLPLKEHLWQPEKNWGYIQFKNSKEVTDTYEDYAEILIKLIDKGFSAAIYTQTSDVEGEVNGLMTYDRKVLKMNEKRLIKINTKVIETLKQK